ncbi:hypothetical protein GGU11DRAFT_742286 [Lentinula aff. detonsa]|nr:hypothetical protein GGU11DRAFT_742286 [Lentinula aff. detonsa]
MQTSHAIRLLQTVFILGDLIRTSFLDGDPDIDEPGVSGFEFLRGLQVVKDMIADDPSERPIMDEAAWHRGSL